MGCIWSVEKIAGNHTIASQGNTMIEERVNFWWPLVESLELE